MECTVKYWPEEDPHLKVVWRFEPGSSTEHGQCHFAGPPGRDWESHIPARGEDAVDLAALPPCFFLKFLGQMTSHH